MGSGGNADGGCFHSRFQSPFYVQRQVFRQHYERFSKIFRKSKVLRYFRNYFANPNHPEFWQPFRTFGIIGKFSEPFRDVGIFLHMAGHMGLVVLKAQSGLIWNGGKLLSLLNRELAYSIKQDFISTLFTAFDTLTVLFH